MVHNVLCQSGKKKKKKKDNGMAGAANGISFETEGIQKRVINSVSTWEEWYVSLEQTTRVILNEERPRNPSSYRAKNFNVMSTVFSVEISIIYVTLSLC